MLFARSLNQGDEVLVQADPDIEKMIPTGGCNLCKFRTHAQFEAGLKQAYWRHRRDSGHDSFWQRKFAPVKADPDERFGLPTFGCVEEGCDFVTRAKNGKMVGKALRKHNARTGHARLARIGGAVTPLIREDYFATNTTTG